MLWHQRRYVRVLLRPTGLMLLALATLIARHLFDAADPGASHRAGAYVLALLFMTSACAGAALAVLGPHLFDQVELPARWTIHVPPRGGSARLRVGDAD